MTHALGIDTGGTFTDAVIIAQSGADAHKARRDRVLASAKSLTTRDDLGRGIRDVVTKIMTPEYRDRIAMVSLSTTLATNAMVEGHGRPAGLVLIGQSPSILQRANLSEAVGTDPVITVGGGHDAHGEERFELDEIALIGAAEHYRHLVSGFAVASYFAVRNVDHEKRAKRLLQQHTGLPVTCSHELSNRLDAPRRALTALINARLVPMVTDLISAIQAMLDDFGISAPLMIVQGDGSLALAEVAMARPVETILSGPAASVIGARWLAECDDGLVADIGGTTTDVALLRHGEPARNRDGANVGGWRTMVEAIDVRTFGLGGDSEVLVTTDANIKIGPQRAIPLSLLAQQQPSILTTLEAQLDAHSSIYDARFVVPLDPSQQAQGLTKLENVLLDTLGGRPSDLRTLLEDPRLERTADRLRRRGIVGFAAFTPSDALHVLNAHTAWCRPAACCGAALMARRWQTQRYFNGLIDDTPAVHNPDEFASHILAEVEVAAGKLLVDTLISGEFGRGSSDNDVATWLIEQALRKRAANNPLGITFALAPQVFGIGAPAEALLAPIAGRLGTTVTVPPFAAVCNAVGAAVGGIVRRVSCTITQPAEGTFRVHGPSSTRDFKSPHAAKAYAIETASQLAEHNAQLAGCMFPNLLVDENDNTARATDDSIIFIESTITVTARQ